jgi:DNA-binding response OmpR family regulator
MKPSDFTILVAEDEKASLFLYLEELSDEGYRVLTAENGLQVLGTLEDQKVDLLMTDVKMPDMHAFEMVPLVRAQFPDLPIIVVSAFKGLEDDFHLMGFHIADFFSKPVDMVSLKERIWTILENRVTAQV